MTRAEVAPMRTHSHKGSSADVCRQNGWGPGTRLVGDEGYGPAVIEITAVGDEKLLAKCLGHRGIAHAPRESTWVLWCREWREATEDDIPKALVVGQRVCFDFCGEQVRGAVTTGPDECGVYRVTGDDERQWVVHAEGLDVESSEAVNV